MVKLANTVERSMFYGAKPDIFEKANILRGNMTQSELLLYDRLRKNQIKGLRFKAQHPIGQFIVDFYCHKLKLVIEVDGSIHEDLDVIEHDANRTFELEKFGLKIFRFNNSEIINDIDSVIKEIEDICNELKTP